jgi:thymidylate synthase ThyX
MVERSRIVWEMYEKLPKEIPQTFEDFLQKHKPEAVTASVDLAQNPFLTFKLDR